MRAHWWRNRRVASKCFRQRWRRYRERATCFAQYGQRDAVDKGVCPPRAPNFGSVPGTSWVLTTMGSIVGGGGRNDCMAVRSHRVVEPGLTSMARVLCMVRTATCFEVLAMGIMIVVGSVRTAAKDAMHRDGCCGQYACERSHENRRDSRVNQMERPTSHGGQILLTQMRCLDANEIRWSSSSLTHQRQKTNTNLASWRITASRVWSLLLTAPSKTRHSYCIFVWFYLAWRGPDFRPREPSWPIRGRISSHRGAAYCERRGSNSLS